MTISRRHFLTYLGFGTYATLFRPPARGQGPAFPVPRRKGPPPDFFQPIAPSARDELVLPPGYRYDVVCAWGDPLGSKDPDGKPEFFGFNNDFVEYLPIDALQGGNNRREGLLWVNHEYPNPLFIGNYPGQGPKTAEQILAEKRSVGGSVVHVRRENGTWKYVPGSRYNRRLTALYPTMEVTGPAAALVGRAVGTLANCSGGRTPWNTILSCEENFADFNDVKDGGWRWSDVAAQKVNEDQYGWVVEIDPFGELPPRKHTALGKFRHENAAVCLGPTGRVVVYMGHDEENQFLYKFVSEERYDPRTPRAEQYKLLAHGTLYVADFVRGKWLPLDLRDTHSKPPLVKEGYRTQGKVLMYTQYAAAELRATPLDRTEVCTIHPLDGSLYIALTYNLTHGNVYGHIVRLLEDKEDPEGDSFRFEVFLAGGPQSGLACPDNLTFDRKGNLWVVCDIASSELNQGNFKPFGNNGVYVVPTGGPAAGDAFQFASGPVECEMTGPCFNEEEGTLFISVQHPGEESRSLDTLTSHWPEGGKAIPRPAVVAITGFPTSGK